MYRYGLIFLLLFGFNAFAHIEIDDAVIRLMPPGSLNTSAYFSIKNSGDTDKFIVAASSSVANTVELHKHIMLGDMMRMEKQQKVLLSAGQTVTFEPGGLHLMFFGLHQALQNAQQVDIQLKMQDGELVNFSALAVEPGTQSHHH
jgi:periplasmic copper chaperone A